MLFCKLGQILYLMGLAKCGDIALVPNRRVWQVKMVCLKPKKCGATKSCENWNSSDTKILVAIFWLSAMVNL